MEIWIRKKGKKNNSVVNSVTQRLKANSWYLRSPWLKSLNEILDILINISPITVSRFSLNMHKKSASCLVRELQIRTAHISQVNIHPVKRTSDNIANNPDENRSWYLLNKGPRELSRYSDSLRVGQSRDRIPAEVRFSPPTVQTDPAAQAASCTIGTGFFAWSKAAGAWRWPPSPT